MNRVAAGAIAGLLATGPMTAFMSRSFKRLPRRDRHPLPPRLITERILNRRGALDGMTDRRRGDLALAAHYAYGAATGAFYPFARTLVAAPPAVTGVAYGLAVWAASYLGWIPATATLTPATRHSRRRNALMLGAHVVWGGGTALIAEGLQRRPAGFDAAGDARVPITADRPELRGIRAPPPARLPNDRERTLAWIAGAAIAAGAAAAWLGSRRRQGRPAPPMG